MAVEIVGDTVLTIGTTAVEITVLMAKVPNGILLVQRGDDSGTVHVGDDAGLTTTTAPPIPKGSYGSVSPHKLTSSSLSRLGRKYLIGSASGQKVYVYLG